MRNAPTSDSTTAEVDLELVARLRVAVARLGRQLRQQSGDGLSPTLQSTLVSIEKRGPLTLGELAAIEQVAPTTVTKIVKRLGADGLVTRTTDPADRRVTRLALTPAGADRLADSRSRRTAFLATKLRAHGTDPEMLQAVAAVLEALAEPAAVGPASGQIGDEAS